MSKVKSSDWKHLQFDVFFYNVFIEVQNMFFMFFYLQMNVLTPMVTAVALPYIL